VHSGYLEFQKFVRVGLPHGTRKYLIITHSVIKSNSLVIWESLQKKLYHKQSYQELCTEELHILF